MSLIAVDLASGSHHLRDWWPVGGAERTEYHPCVAWDRLAEICGQFLTKSQLEDFQEAVVGFKSLAEDPGPRNPPGPGPALKSGVDGFETLVARLEAWSARNNNDRKSAGRVITDPNGPINGGSSMFGSNTDAAYGTKSLDWGRDFTRAREMAGKALLEIGSTAVECPIFGEPNADARQARFVYQLMPSSEAEGGSFSYLAQTTRTNNAAEVPTGALKPVSVFTLERVTDTVKVFAHVTEPIDRYLLEDAPIPRPSAVPRCRAALRAGACVRCPRHRGHQHRDRPREGWHPRPGRYSLRDHRAPGGGHRADRDCHAAALWATIEDEATTTFASNDNAPAATEALNRRLYGIPVVVTNSATSGEALIGDFRGSARIFRTGSASVTIHDSQPRDSGGTLYADYAFNQLVLRAEMRAEVAMWRPAGFRRVSEAS